jgi:hypothetical protein
MPKRELWAEYSSVALGLEPTLRLSVGHYCDRAGLSRPGPYSYTCYSRRARGAQLNHWRSHVFLPCDFNDIFASNLEPEPLLIGGVVSRGVLHGPGRVG